MSNPVEQSAAERANDILEFLGKAGGLLVLLTGFLKWAWAPYQKRKKRIMAETIKEILGEELGALKMLIEREDSCADRMDIAVEQIKELFSEHDLLTKVVFDNRDRLDEQTELLSAFGLDNDRRRDPERLSQMLDQLEARRNARRRRLPIREEESDAPHRNS